jgi:penicillin amidase
MRLLKRLVYLSASLVIIAVAALWLGIRASLPQLDGERVLDGLSAPVRISRDELGVATVHASNRRDAALATGFVHAQERFFQMDLMRRLAAGELADLVGEAGADHDMRQRVHRMRSVARRVLDTASTSERSIAHAYARGVNAGVEALSVRPFEYLILRAQPSAWLAEDIVLVTLAMYFRLHDERGEHESRLGRLHEALPPAMFAFLTQPGTDWDAPLVGDPAPSLAVPGVEICDVRRVEQNPLARAARPAPARLEEPAAVGSNGWAVSPRRTRDGVAMLANDMHLGLAVPNTWFRMRLRVDDASGSGDGIDVTGATLPGTPAIVVGSNGRVAWGFTNTYGDWVDLVELEIDPQDARRYRTANGFREFEESSEIIAVRGAAPRTLSMRSTVWGPVIDEGPRGRPRALRWLAHDAEATNLGLIGMERAGDVEQAMEVAGRSGIPPQNLILADSSGNIAWTVIGRIPRRNGYDPRLPGSWAGDGRGWDGWLPAREYPRVVNPPSGALWSANSRAVDGAALAAIGDGGYALGSRATQIRDGLLALPAATESDMLAIQLDDRALFLSRWRALLLRVLSGDASHADARRRELRRTVAGGAGSAAVDDAGYRLVRNFRLEVARRVWSTVLLGCGGLHAGASSSPPRQWEGALWRIIEERPMHLLNPRYADWQEFLLAAADAAVGECGDGDLGRCTWGDVNVTRIRHPLARAMPLLAEWLDMPARPLPGDTHMPRVQRPAMGASLRFAVSPGHEASGYFHMPSGQSGHPMSPFYDAGHRAWEEGTPTPFLPGAERYRLSLIPAG